MPPDRPHGYRCYQCTHAWDATGPGASREEIIAALDRIKAGLACPECGDTRVCLGRPDQYERWKAEREMQDAGGSAA